MTALRLLSDDAHDVKCALAADVLRSDGNLRLRVTGHSMLPAIWPGDALIVERAPADSVDHGDIVLFSSGTRFVAHRVVAKIASCSAIETQGDAVAQADQPIPFDEVLGRVAFIVRDGKCVTPGKELALPQRAAASFLRRSQLAARVVVGIHSFRQALQRTSSQVTEPSLAPVSR
jgi:signal peptidase I